MANNPKYTNRLAKEKSPYLLQHAHNPVDWYPWGEEAFAEAKELDRPIFLSIGYATCHWCHKMEKESFENEELAKEMNATFVNVKIDREELPEIDSLYMEFAQSMMSGAAGWPLNLVLTPELQPFFAATYLPPHTLQGMVGLTDVVHRIKEVWASEERSRVIEQANKIVQVFEDTIHTSGDTVVPLRKQVDDAVDLIFQLADPVFGGMKGAPKFPIGYQMNFLTHYSLVRNESRALFLVEKTLDKMYRGGIYDHLGGGFSRYSIDEEWLIPHFEKMLYDNALLMFTYLEVWKTTKKKFYKEVTEEIAQYLLRDMQDRKGGFSSAEDSDSEGKEGFFYTWSYEEINKVLSKDEALLATEFFDMTPHGNFEKRNILHVPATIEEFSSLRGIHPLQLAPLLRDMKKKLWEIREKREHPFKDDKILVSWNGLAIHAFAEAGAALREKTYIDAAIKAAHFLQTSMWDGKILYHRWREGDTQFHGGIDDYAFLIRGLISLFEVGAGNQWLQWALELTLVMQELFKTEGGAFYQTDGSDPNLLLRKCPYSDGAEPSGNAVQAENLLRLYQMTMNPAYLQSAEDVLRAAKKYIDSYPPGYCFHLMNILRYNDAEAPTIVVALNEQEQWYDQLHRVCFETLIPHRAVIWKKENDEDLEKLLPWTQEYVPERGKTAVYICRQGACQAPITELTEMVKAIRKL